MSSGRNFLRPHWQPHRHDKIRPMIVLKSIPQESAMKSSRRIAILALVFAAWLGSGSFLAAQAGATQGTPRQTAAKPKTPARQFTILQINDVYKVEGLEGGNVGGLARVRTLRTQIESQGQPVLVMVAGDLLFPSVMSKYLRAQPMIKCLNLLDGDAAAFDPGLIVTFGNHEFDDKDPGLLLGRLAQSDFRWVGSNVFYKSSSEDSGHPFSTRLKNVYDTLVVNIAGVRVGIFGLTVDDEKRDYVGYAYDWRARQAVITKALAQLHARHARLIVALTHQNMTEDIRMVQAFPAINLVVGGHEHFFQQRQVGRTWITKADSDAQSAIEIEVQVPIGGPIQVTPHKVVMDSQVPQDSLENAEVQKWLSGLGTAVKQQTGHGLSELVGSTEHTLEGVETAVRRRESALGNFLTDVVRARMKTQVAFLNGGAIRINDNIPAGGQILQYDMEGIFFYDDDLVSFDLTGAQLLDILRASVAFTDIGDGRFLQVSGLRFRYHVSGTAGNPAYDVGPADVEILQADGRTYAPLDLNARYSAGTLDYVWSNGSSDGYPIFAKGNGGSSPPLTNSGPEISWRKATEEAIAALPDRHVTTNIEGRIVRVDERK